MYCLKCKSRLYPADAEYIQATGVCSYCVSYDSTPDKRFREAFNRFKQQQISKKKLRSNYVIK